MRAKHSEFYHLYHQARFFYDNFFEYLCMNQQTFDFLYSKLEVRLTKVTTNYKNTAPINSSVDILDEEKPTDTTRSKVQLMKLAWDAVGSACRFGTCCIV